MDNPNDEISNSLGVLMGLDPVYADPTAPRMKSIQGEASQALSGIDPMQKQHFLSMSDSKLEVEDIVHITKVFDLSKPSDIVSYDEFCAKCIREREELEFTPPNQRREKIIINESAPQYIPNKTGVNIIVIVRFNKIKWNKVMMVPKINAII